VRLVSRYSRITEEILRDLESIVGPSSVVTDEEKMLPYAHDEVSEAAYVKMPEVVVRPGTKEEIASIMKLANREKIPVTPRGAGTGLSAGCVPVFGGIVLSLRETE
jgi:glycolate oxidase